MSFTSWLWGANQIDEAVDKATSELLPSGTEDIALNLEICDQIRSKSVQPKDAMRALKRRLNHKNPNVQLLALGLTDICIKNGGDSFLVEVASREFMENLVSLLRIPTLNHDVKNEILRLVQNWALAFEGKPVLSYTITAYDQLKRDGFSFPPKDLALTSAAMVDTQTAPEWIDSDKCMRCRDDFSFTNRKHHCRNCGLVYDHKCSSKLMPLPHFGITQEVRVCETCYSKLHRSKDKTGGDPRHRRHASTSRTSRNRGAQDLYDAELQRAIQLSLEEVGAETGNSRPGYVPSQPNNWQASEPPIIDHSTRPIRAAEDEDDPDLKAAIAASLAEAQAPRASAPVATPRMEEAQYMYGGPGVSQSYPPSVAQPSIPALPNYDLEPMESDAILTFSQTVEQVRQQGGRDITRYPAVNELYRKATELRPKLATSLDDTDRKEKLLSEMHDKMSQAVKLYDSLLTRQVSQPSWRSAPQHTVPSHSYTIDGSYVTSPQSAQPQYTSYYASSPGQEQPYQTPYNQPVQAPSQPWQQFQQQQQYNPPAHIPVPQSPSVAPQHYSAMSQMGYQDSAPAPISVPQTPAAQSVAQPAWPQQQPYQQVQSPSLAPPQQYTPQISIQAPQPAVYAPPPPQPIQTPQLASFASAPTSQLTRHSTVSYTAAPTGANGLGRHNTVAHAPQAAPAVVPNFPSVPTSNPQSYAMYGPPAPIGVEQEERKEALLIDL